MTRLEPALGIMHVSADDARSLAGIYELFPKDMPPLEESTSLFKDLNSSDRDLAGLLSKKEKVSFGGVLYSTGELLAEINASERNDIEHHWFRVDRTAFRQWLSHGLQITWAKEFVRYEETDGGVCAFFADGSSAQGTLLIAADGAHSRCRNQLMGPGNVVLEHAAGGTIRGDFNVTREEYRELLQKGAAFLTATSPEYHFFMGPRFFSDIDRAGTYYWAVTWDNRDDPRIKGWTPDTHGDEARQMALKLCHDLHPSLRRFIEQTSGDELLDSKVQLLQWAPDVDRLPGRRVTLMGDSLHTMTPFKGAGANTALLDAFDLAQLIVHADGKGVDVSKVIPGYEATAVPRGRETKEFSKSASLQPDPTHWSRTMERVFAAGYKWEKLDLEQVALGNRTQS